MSLKAIVGCCPSVLPVVLSAAVALALVGCGPGGVRDDAATEPAAAGTTSPASVAAEPAPPPPGEAPSFPARVFFLRPQEGDVMVPDFRARFGVENFIIEPAGAVRAGAGHYHVGIDTDCLPAGATIPRTAPWIDLSDGSSEVRMQLAPGEHRLCLQAGDGEHRALAGAGTSELVTFTVEKEQPRPERPKA